MRLRASAASWAGLVVLGDGDLVPVPGGQRRGLVRIGWVALALCAGAVLVSILVSRNHRPASLSAP